MSNVDVVCFGKPLTPFQMVARMRGAMQVFRAMRSGPGHPKMPDDTAFRILLRAVENREFDGLDFIVWKATGHGTLGAIFENRRTAIRHMHVVDFETFRPRRLCRVF